MPEISDVVPGEDVLDTWGNQIRDRTNMRYSSLANLEASEPGADDGSLRWTDDAGLVVRSAAVWVPVRTGTDPINTTFGAVTRGAIVASATASVVGTWVDLGSSSGLNLGSANVPSWVSVIWSGSLFLSATGTKSVLQMRMGISDDDGANFDFNGAKWVTCDETTRRAGVSVAGWRDLGVPAGSVRVKAQALLSSGPSTNVESGQIIATMANTSGIVP